MIYGKEIRRLFLDYFKKKDHTLIQSSPLIPANDPTLLFTNAGMVQFKDIFTGREKTDCKKAVTSQKCIRAGGKHNDLEQVGYTARHHTFFEMLGNFSFGDYFKEEAINFAWDFLIHTISLPKERLWITIYEKDDESYRIWKDQIGVPDKMIIRLGNRDNFWSMGDVGPCGPCSEIHIDQGEAIGCTNKGCAPGCNCERYLEIWNLVFMEYNRNENSELKPLPIKCIDTGMGLERLTSVVQGVKSNYDTDLFIPIINTIEELFSKKYGSTESNDFSFKVIADHSRASCFMIADGMIPSNEGRGYVLRRIIRRAARHGRMLGKDEPFLYKTIGSVVELMQDAYPSLKDKVKSISDTVLSEEERFITTLDYGLSKIDEIIDSCKKGSIKVVSGDDLFKLYDTYGFPVDLAQEIFKENRFKCDLKAFNVAMEKQKITARQAWKGQAVETNSLYISLAKDIHSEFTGYSSLEDSSEIKAIIKDNSAVKLAEEKEEVKIVTENTPFYAESGGQIGDSGEIKGCNGSIFLVRKTITPVSGLIIHEGMVLKGRFDLHDKVTLNVNSVKRRDTELNHSATHLLHAALRGVLGDHVRQAGSSVGHDRLRFDFNHFKPLTSTELSKIERLINTKIRENISINTCTMKLEDAIQGGATALFGEKYEKDVRVVEIPGYSKELCGGTHTKKTGDIGTFKIISESGIAAGIRRIEALTGKYSLEYIYEEESVLVNLRRLLKVSKNEEQAKLQRLLEKNKEMAREIETLKERLLKATETDNSAFINEVNGINILVKRMDNVDMKYLRIFMDKEKTKIKSGIIIVGTILKGKPSLLAGVTKDLTTKYSANSIIKELSKKIGGNGGGRPDFAQAGGSKPEELNNALGTVISTIKKLYP